MCLLSHQETVGGLFGLRLYFPPSLPNHYEGVPDQSKVRRESVFLLREIRPK